MLISRTKPAQKTDPSLDPDDQAWQLNHKTIRFLLRHLFCTGFCYSAAYAMKQSA